jgi:hypothetical protein
MKTAVYISLFLLVCGFFNESFAKDKTNVAFRSGKVVSAEVANSSGGVENLSKYEPAPKFKKVGYACVTVKLDKGRTLSIYDYFLTDGYEKYRCIAIKKNDGQFDAKLWKVDDAKPEDLYGLLFLVPQPAKNIDSKYAMKFNLVKEKRKSPVLDFRNCGKEGFTLPSKIPAEGNLGLKEPYPKPKPKPKPKPDKALALWLPMNEPPDKLKDETGKLSKIKASGKIQVVKDGKAGSAYKFSGKDQKITIEGMKYPRNFTLAFWFKIDVGYAKGKNYEYIFSHGAKIEEPNTLNIIICGKTAPSVKNSIRTCFSDKNDKYPIEKTSLDMPLDKAMNGKWHFYALVVSQNEGAKIYLDGNLEKADPSHGKDEFKPSGNMIIGTRSYDADGRNFKGQIDDLRIYKEALSTEQIKKLFKKPGVPDVLDGK